MSEVLNPITIVLADDHPVVRQGLRSLLDRQPGMQVVGETGDGLEAIRLVQQLNPNVLTVDVTMPGLNGLDVTRQVSKGHSATHVIIISMHDTQIFVAEALRSGADGYICKSSAHSDLVQAVREVAAGKRFLSRSKPEQATELDGAEPAGMEDILTDREREIFQLVVEGQTNARIGKRLFISPRTVESHRRTMMRKLGASNLMELLVYAVKQGILSVEQLPVSEPNKSDSPLPDNAKTK